MSVFPQWDPEDIVVKLNEVRPPNHQILGFFPGEAYDNMVKPRRRSYSPEVPPPGIPLSMTHLQGLQPGSSSLKSMVYTSLERNRSGPLFANPPNIKIFLPP